MPLLPGKLRRLLPYVAIFGLLAGVYLLPPDTSLSEVRKAGVLRACMPPDYPPLVTGDRDAPGIDVELLQALAKGLGAKGLGVKGLGVKLVITPNPAMGQDFNPRNWHVTRSQCEVLAGGVVVSPITKSFLETSPSYAQTGWALLTPRLLAPKLPADLEGRRVGVLTGISGLDRLALSRHLRSRNAQVTIVPNAVELAQGLRDGRFEVAITEWLLAGQLAAREGFAVAWADADLPRYPVALGLWKGDLTLKRAIATGMDELRRNGEMARIVGRYIGGAKAGSASPESKTALVSRFWRANTAPPCSRLHYAYSPGIVARAYDGPAGNLRRPGCRRQLVRQTGMVHVRVRFATGDDWRDIEGDFDAASLHSRDSGCDRGHRQAGGFARG